MAKQFKIRCTEMQKDQINSIKENNNLGSQIEVLHFLLRNQKRVEHLENIIKNVHQRTLL